MAKKEIDEEAMLEESSEEILLEETTGAETMLEESSDSDVLLEEDTSESVLLEEEAEALLEETTGQAAAISSIVESVSQKAEEKAADEKRYKAAREPLKKEAEADRRRMAEKGEAEQNAEEAKRRAEEAKRKAEEKRLRKEAEELKKKKEALRERKKTITWVIAALLALIAGTWMAFALKEPNDSWGNSLALGYTLGLVVFFAIIYGLFSIIGIDVEGNDVEKWRTTLCRSAFVLSLIGIIIFCIIKGTISLSTTALSIYLGLFVTSCTNGISNFFSKKK